MKTEPTVFSFQDLFLRANREEFWDGVRNYQARNFMLNHMKPGHNVIVYHSNASPPGVAGFAQIVAPARPDPSARDETSAYYDPQATNENPRWYGVTIGNPVANTRFVSLSELRAHPLLKDMLLLKRGQRLSIQPLSEHEYSVIWELANS